MVFPQGELAATGTLLQFPKKENSVHLLNYEGVNKTGVTQKLDQQHPETVRIHATKHEFTAEATNLTVVE